MALTIDKTMLDALHMTPETPVHITFNNGSMIVTPVQTGVPNEELEEAISRLRPRYKNALKNLAK